MAIPRLPRYDPPPAEVLGPEVIARATRIREVHRIGVYWHLDPTDVKRRLFTAWLIDEGRLGKDDWN